MKSGQDTRFSAISNSPLADAADQLFTLRDDRLRRIGGRILDLVEVSSVG